MARKVSMFILTVGLLLSVGSFLFGVLIEKNQLAITAFKFGWILVILGVLLAWASIARTYFRKKSIK